MTIEEANNLIKRAKKFIGQEIEISSYDNISKQFTATNYKFIEIVNFIWKVQNEQPTVDLWAILETLDNYNQIKVGLEKMTIVFEGNTLRAIKYKEIPITFKGSTESVYVAAIASTNNRTQKNGFLACTYKVKDGEPSDPKKGNKLSNILYRTEEEAIREGSKILKEQIKQKIKLNTKK